MVYAIGAAIPMLAIAYGGQAVTTRVRSIARISPAAAAGIRRRRDRLRGRVLLSIRHADRGVADRILPQRPARPVINPTEGDFHDATIARHIRHRGGPLPDRHRPARHRRRDGARRRPLRSRSPRCRARRPISPASTTGSIPRRSRSSDLRGKVVLVDFWTYGCVNCVNTLPHVTELYAKYKDRGLVVVGVHTPEFPFERSASNVQAALKRHGITYPVAQDNEFADLERLPQPVLAGAIHRRSERKDRVPARRRRPVRADRPHHRAPAQRQ